MSGCIRIPQTGRPKPILPASRDFSSTTTVGPAAWLHGGNNDVVHLDHHVLALLTAAADLIGVNVPALACLQVRQPALRKLLFRGHRGPPDAVRRISNTALDAGYENVAQLDLHVLILVGARSSAAHLAGIELLSVR